NDTADPEHQFGSRHVGAGRNRNARIFLEGPAIEHFQIGAAAHHGVKLGRTYAGRFAVMLDGFGECLAGTVTARKRDKPGLLPGRYATIETREVGVSGAGKNDGGPFRGAIIVVAEDDAGRFARL